MKQELFETISRITGHDCVDSELNEIIGAMQAVHVRMDVEGLKYMTRSVGNNAVMIIGCQDSIPKMPTFQHNKSEYELTIHDLRINSELYKPIFEPKRGKRDRKTWQPQKYMNGIKK